MAGTGDEDEGGLISAINVTPLVDVTLVLLIIFMVTAKIIVSQGMPMDLPKAASSSAEQLQMIFSVELTEDGRTFVDTKLVANDEIVGAMGREAKRKNPDLRAVIRADQRVHHGRVIHVLDLLKQADISKIAFAVSTSKGKDGETAPLPQPGSP
jgi:biopolymer transport protein ExbD